MISFKVYQQLFEIKEGLVRIECINLPLYNEFEEVYPLYKDVDETTFMEQMNHTYTIQEKAIMAIIGIKYPELIKNKDLNYISSICEFLAKNNISPFYFKDYVQTLCNNQVYNYAMFLYSNNYGITKHTILFDLLYELYDLANPNCLSFIIDFLARLASIPKVLFDDCSNLLDIYNKILAKMEEIEIDAPDTFTAIDYQTLHELFKINRLNSNLAMDLFNDLKDVDLNYIDYITKIKECLTTIKNYNIVPLRIRVQNKNE